MPSIEEGNITIRAGSVEYVPWQVLNKNDEVVDISGATSAVLRLINIITGSTKTFSTNDSPQKFYITDVLTATVELRPDEDDFPSEASFYFYIDFVDSNGPHSIPDDMNNTLQILAKIA